MSYLQQFDQISPDRPQERLALINRWIRTEWRPFFAELRERRPVLSAPGITLVTRYRDVMETLSRHETFSVRIYGSKMDATVGPFMLGRDATEFNWRDKSIMRSMLSLDDLGAIRQIVRDVADEILENHEGDRLDVVQSLSRIVPLRVCAQYFGFAGPDDATMLRWSKTTQWNFFKNLTNDPAVHAASVQSGQEMKAYIERLVTLPSHAPPANSIVSRLLQTKLPAEIGFDQERLVANVAGLLIGAVETTSQAIVQSLDQILRRPAVQAAAAEAARNDDDSLLDPIAWEALRFEPINPLLFRFVERDAVVGGGTSYETKLSRGTIVFACTASAMHDDREIDDPDVFTPGRPRHQYLHFGYGEHECLGVHVGSVIIPETIKRILLLPEVRRLPGDGSAIDFGDGPFPERYEIAVRHS